MRWQAFLRRKSYVVILVVRRKAVNSVLVAPGGPGCLDTFHGGGGRASTSPIERIDDIRQLLQVGPFQGFSNANTTRYVLPVARQAGAEDHPGESSALLPRKCGDLGPPPLTSRRHRRRITAYLSPPRPQDWPGRPAEGHQCCCFRETRLDKAFTGFGTALFKHRKRWVRGQGLGKVVFMR